jgi:hypothetical protein
VPVIFGGKSNLSVLPIDINNPMVANGYLMSVSTQVFNDIFWTSTRLFSIYHPLSEEFSIHSFLARLYILP